MFNPYTVIPNLVEREKGQKKKAKLVPQVLKVSISNPFVTQSSMYTD